MTPGIIPTSYLKKKKKIRLLDKGRKTALLSHIGKTKSHIKIPLVLPQGKCLTFSTLHLNYLNSHFITENCSSEWFYSRYIWFTNEGTRNKIVFRKIQDKWAMYFLLEAFAFYPQFRVQGLNTFWYN